MEVQNVKKEMSFRFDPKTNRFCIDQLGSEILDLFKKAGIKNEELVSQDYAPFIFETILTF